MAIGPKQSAKENTMNDMKLSSKEITTENAVPMAAIQGYQNGKEYGYEAKNIATMWAGHALDSYIVGVEIGAAEKEAKQ